MTIDMSAWHNMIGSSILMQIHLSQMYVNLYFSFASIWKFFLSAQFYIVIVCWLVHHLYHISHLVFSLLFSSLLPLLLLSSLATLKPLPELFAMNYSLIYTTDPNMATFKVCQIPSLIWVISVLDSLIICLFCYLLFFLPLLLLSYLKSLFLYNSYYNDYQHDLEAFLSLIPSLLSYTSHASCHPFQLVFYFCNWSLW